jgi:hypothetical protein
MAALIFTNNASSLLNTTISNSDTTIELATGFGARFPQPSVGVTSFYATLEDDQGNFEVVECTDRSGDLLTVVRGQDNTSAQGFTQNVTRVELRLTAGVVEQFLQVSGDIMAGNLDMNANELQNAVLTGAATSIQAGEIVGVPVRGDTGVASNELVVPSGGGRATVGGAAILAVGDDIVAELDTAGVIILDSATVGVRIPDSGYLRVEGTTQSEYISLTHDDTDANFIFGNTADLNILSLSGDVVLGAGIDLNLSENQILQAELVDFRLTTQTVAGATTVNIDYEAGSYVTLNLNATQLVNLNVINVPAGVMAPLRVKVVQDGTGGRTITNWPTGTTWQFGNPISLSTGANAEDFVDLWTDDGGASWYAAFGLNWS